MTRSMGDATVAAYLPDNLDMYAGYVDGAYRSYDAIRARFPGKLVVPIATQTSGNVGVVFDGPPDNGDWPGVVAWCVRARARGVDPGVYTDGSSWAIGIQAFNGAGVALPHWWIANWNGVADVPAGAVAHQYASVSNRYDLSAVADYWPGVDPAPSKPGPPAPPKVPAPPPGPSPAQLALLAAQVFEEDDMIMVHEPSGGIYLISGSLYVHIPSTADVSAFLGAGVKQVDISAAFNTALEQGAAGLQGKLSGSLNVSGSLTAS